MFILSSDFPCFTNQPWYRLHPWFDYLPRPFVEAAHGSVIPSEQWGLPDDASLSRCLPPVSPTLPAALDKDAGKLTLTCKEHRVDKIHQAKSVSVIICQFNSFYLMPHVLALWTRYGYSRTATLSSKFWFPHCPIPTCKLDMVGTTMSGERACSRSFFGEEMLNFLDF